MPKASRPLQPLRGTRHDGLGPSPPSRRRTAVYPGSFDPLTYGHLDVLQRGLNLFDRVIVAILKNPAKNELFSIEERIRMIEDACRARGFAEPGGGTIEVGVFDGLLVDYAEEKGAVAILRGVRAVADFEYEFQMALMNRKLDPHIQTVFMMPGEAFSYVSSRLVKEVAALGGDLSGIVPPAIEKQLHERLDERSAGRTVPRARRAATARATAASAKKHRGGSLAGRKEPR